MKTLDDIKNDMSRLYDEVEKGDCDLKLAAELANITGKYLKAVQLDLAEQIFTHNKGTQAPRITTVRAFEDA